MGIPFTKMHGLGNDFIVMRGPLDISPDQVAEYCKRHTGVGADGLLVVSPIDDANVKMEYWNADGSVAEMCGNGLRCVTRFAVDNQLVNPGSFTVDTKAGPLQVTWNGKNPERITTQVGKVRVDDAPVVLHGLELFTANVGNPHAMAFVKDVRSAPVEVLGPIIENDDHFPSKTNVEFVQVLSPKAIRMRVWERGVGITLACATGMVACAATTARFREGQTPMRVEVPGGMAHIWQDEQGYYCLRGPAVTVYEGATK